MLKKWKRILIVSDFGWDVCYLVNINKQNGWLLILNSSLACFYYLKDLEKLSILWNGVFFSSFINLDDQPISHLFI